MKYFVTFNYFNVTICKDFAAIGAALCLMRTLMENGVEFHVAVK